jgi:hypothetical protein
MAPIIEQIAWAATVIGTSSEYRGPGRDIADRRNAKEQAAHAHKGKVDVDVTKDSPNTYLTREHNVRWMTAAWDLLVLHLLTRFEDLEVALETLVKFKQQFKYSTLICR